MDPDKRLIIIRLKSKHAKISIIQRYAPMDDYDDSEQDAYQKRFKKLQNIFNSIHKYHIKIIMVDFNAKVGQPVEEERKALGPNGLKCQRNDDGYRFVNFCLLNELYIAG